MKGHLPNANTLPAVAVLCMTIMFGCNSGAVEVDDSEDDSTPPPNVQALVLAHYYPWYGTPDGPSGRWNHWDPVTPHHGSADTPSLGFYDSRDPEVLRQHIDWARDAGIDAFVVSWWGPRSFEEGSLNILLELLEEEQVEDFAITVMIEQASSGSNLRDQIRYVLERNGASPAWLRADGRPVLFLFGRVASEFSRSTLEAALGGRSVFAVADGVTFSDAAAAFDGILFYNPLPDLAGYESVFPDVVNEHNASGRIVVAAALPGYDDTNTVRPARFRISRTDGAMYRRMWRTADLGDWVAITSWNEWHEGTEIEPSEEYGNLYLRLTDSLQTEWRAARRALGANTF